jgi:hypothetical protein
VDVLVVVRTLLPTPISYHIPEVRNGQATVNPAFLGMRF